ncbi:MAG: hypothetical protein LBT79_02320, partial [Elusimicrobiota bacterium]|nr:hypothetical protein [Elusimicrobiota bacterium]
AFYKDYIINKEMIVKYDVLNNTVSYFNWGHGLEFIKSPENKEGQNLLKYFRSAIAVSDYLLKKTGH